MKSLKAIASLLFIHLTFAPILYSQENVKRPNIIFIMADDLGIAEIGPYGQNIIKTPSLDKMANEGLKFNNFYTGSPVCGPARCNLMTGLHNGHCRMKENDVNYLRDEDLTVAEILKYGGYITGIFGKWGLSFDAPNKYQPESFPTSQGFDEFLGYRDQRHAHNFYPEFLVDGTDSLLLDNKRSAVWQNKDFGKIGDRGQGDADPADEKQYSHDLFVDRALKFIDNHKDTNFFLYLPFTIPHLNNEGAGAIDKGYEVPSMGQYANMPNWTVMMKSYAAMVTLMDKDIGRVMDRLKAHNIDNNTLIMFTSDNGPTFIKTKTDFYADGTPVTTPDGRIFIADIFDHTGLYMGVKGMKRDVYERGIRMPTLAYWPGVIKPGRTTNHKAYFPDVLPTLAEIGGVSTPTNLDGIPFTNILKGDTLKQAQHDYLFWSLGDRAIRKGKWKMVRERNVYYLYDIEADPGELADLSKTNATKFNELKKIWEDESKQVVVANWTPALVPPAIVSTQQPKGYGMTIPFSFNIKQKNLSLRFLINGSYQVKISDLKGKVLHTSEKVTNLYEYSLSNIHSGVYHLSVRSSKGRQWLQKFTLL